MEALPSPSYISLHTLQYHIQQNSQTPNIASHSEVKRSWTFIPFAFSQSCFGCSDNRAVINLGWHAHRCSIDGRLTMTHFDSKIQRVFGIVRNSKIDDANSIFVFLYNTRAILLKQMVITLISTPISHLGLYKSNFFPVKGGESSGVVDTVPSPTQGIISDETVPEIDGSGGELASRLFGDKPKPGNWGVDPSFDSNWPISSMGSSSQEFSIMILLTFKSPWTIPFEWR